MKELITTSQKGELIMKFIKFIIGIIIMVIAFCLRALRITMFDKLLKDWENEKPWYYRWGIMLKYTFTSWFNWVYMILGALLFAPYYLVYQIGRFIWSSIMSLFTRKKAPLC